MLTINDLTQIQELIDFAIKKAFLVHDKELHDIKTATDDLAKTIKEYNSTKGAK